MTATVSGTTIYLQSIAGGALTNYPISWGLADKIGNNAESLLPTLPVRVGLSGSTASGGTDNGGFVYALDLGTDPAGTVFGANDSVNGNWNYYYDNLNRLQEASTPALGYKYDYDRYGNRLQQTPLNGGNPLSAVYLNNRLVATGVIYDASGNMIQDGNHTYAYDAEKRLISVDNGATATYTYSAAGLRVRSTIGATFNDFIHGISGRTVGVLGPGGVLLRQEIGGLATYSDAAYFHHRDWLGNLRAVTDQTGAIRKTCTNLPFGDALTCTSAGITPMNFTGYMRDSETNLDFANARYYTSQFGRFMSRDPIGGNVFRPQSQNAYAYVMNQALSAVDPTGMDACGIINGVYSCGIDFTTGGQGGSSGGTSVSGGPFGNNGSTGPGGSLALCQYFDCGFSLGGGPAVPGAPSAAQLKAEDDTFAEGSLAYQVFGPPSHKTWASAYSWGEAAFIGTGVVLAAPVVVEGLIAAPGVATNIASRGSSALVNVAARGYGWLLGATGGTGVVLGRYPEYLDAAEEMGANALNVAPRIYNFFNNAGAWWTLNQSFLQASINRGQQFFLSNAPLGQEGSYFAPELEYLISKGIGPDKWQYVNIRFIGY